MENHINFNVPAEIFPEKRTETGCFKHKLGKTQFQPVLLMTDAFYYVKII